MKQGKCRVLVSTDPIETRVAVLRGDSLDQYFIERRGKGRILGNIYAARVEKVIPGIRAAFIDIGLTRSAFLPSTQVVSEEFLDAARSGTGGIGREKKRRKGRRRGVKLIEKSIHEGEEIIVQVISLPGHGKGAKVTTYISIPGRYVVFIPTIRGLGVSRKIQGEKERARLKKAGEALVKETGSGFIIRSASEGAGEEKIRREAVWLHSRWKEAQEKSSGRRPPYMMLADLTLPEAVLRDLRDEEVQEVMADDPSTLEAMRNYAQSSGISAAGSICLWEKREDMFESLGVEEKIERSFARKIMLASGGHIVIDHAEALTAIDVNTGSYIGNGDPVQTALTTNLEAVREIASQLKLRRTGGLIILDLIDMEREDHKELVYKELVKEVRKGKAKVSVRRISDMGLVEMTREHYGASVVEMFQEKCWYCDGTGSIFARDAVCGKMIRAILRAMKRDPGDLSITAHQSIALKMESEFGEYIRDIEGNYQAKIRFDPRIDVHMEYFNISRV